MSTGGRSGYRAAGRSGLAGGGEERRIFVIFTGCKAAHVAAYTAQRFTALKSCLSFKILNNNPRFRIF